MICLPGGARARRRRGRARAGTRALCVISAGFAETGPRARERQEELLALVRAHGARLIGPNCLGIAVSDVRLNATFGPRALPPGNVGFSSQSGALGLALARAGRGARARLSSFVSIGNKADVSSNDLLEYWEDDAETDVDPALPRVVREPAQVRPPRSPRRTEQADPGDEGRPHPRGRKGGRLAHRRARRLRAGGRRPVPAGRRDPRRRRSRSSSTLPALLSSQPLPRGKRVAVLTNAGGLGILCADACEAAGLELPTLAPADPRGARAQASARGEPREPDRHARLGDRRDLRGRAAAPSSPTPASTP